MAQPETKKDLRQVGAATFFVKPIPNQRQCYHTFKLDKCDNTAHSCYEEQQSPWAWQ
eukprot:COSAG02_NODE_2011_length_10119_cov_11.569960_8_plen_57_part_00